MQTLTLNILNPNKTPAFLAFIGQLDFVEIVDETSIKRSFAH